MILAYLSRFRSLAVAAFACALCMDAAFAQSTQAGCVLEQVQGTSRQTLVCQDGLTIIVEGGARFRLVDRNRDGKADAVVLQRKAVLLDAPSGSSFEVITPQAIAAVRGTKWAVDAAAGKTSVFVVRGSVDVRRPGGGGGVVLGAGDGVDVERGTAPLTVKYWGAARVAALMARFGQ
jgi:ferric-dicitrate binding protein FerR (iron transport regulator)